MEKKVKKAEGKKKEIEKREEKRHSGAIRSGKEPIKSYSRFSAGLILILILYMLTYMYSKFYTSFVLILL